ncbi:hypothetical protein ACFWN1_32445 [Streptomyces sp. NPDC058459]|uniref:hypothetical protein n=1 Tax=Streptomyces sp. NPDC058459 TaxID=3346508 RepID=UPI003649F9C9
MDAVEEALVHIAREREKAEDARVVSSRRSADWLDVRSPGILAALRSTDAGERPAGGWSTFLRDKARATPAPSASPSAA